MTIKLLLTKFSVSGGCGYTTITSAKRQLKFEVGKKATLIVADVVRDVSLRVYMSLPNIANISPKEIVPNIDA